MRASRLPTLLPRLAIAATALAAGAITFTTAGGLVAFGLWADHPPRGDAQPIVLRTIAPKSAGDRRPSPRAPRRAVAPAAPAATAATAATAEPAARAGARGHRAPPPAAVAFPDEPQPLPRPDLPPVEPAPPAPRPAQPAPPLEPLTAVVGESADAIERALQRIRTALASPTTPGGS